MSERKIGHWESVGVGEVYFDDFKIEHIKSPVVESQSFYPFGLTFDHFQRESSTRNRYLYNQGAGDKKFKTERIVELDLNVDQSQYRTFDYITGRWWQVDPKADAGGQESWSTYHFGFDNPIRYNDPNGDCPPDVPCTNPLPNMQVRQNRASNLGPGNVRTDGTRPHDGHDLRAETGTNVQSSMAGTVVSSYSSTSYGNTVVVKTNTHPEAQPGFVGPISGTPSPISGVPERNVYVQYSHLTERSVNVGDQLTMGQSVGTSGQTGNAQNQPAEEAHLHIQVGTALASPGGAVDRNTVVSPNLVYNGVSFESANPNANQTNTGVIKTTTANGQTTRTYQAPGNQSETGNTPLTYRRGPDF